jgi:NodT family efflux transporter outer membrane factor (OMF) lipoprotein
MPDERPEAPPLPSAWQDAPVGAQTSLTSWWESFDDPLLNRLVGEGLAQGPDVRLALLRVREARAQSRTALSAYLPELSLTARGDYADQIDPNGAHTMTGSYGPAVSWEIPLFARAEAAIVGSRANTQSALADARGAQVTLAADIAQAYVDLRAARASYVALDEQVQAATQLAQILETAVEAGFTSVADASDARRLAESSRARLPALMIQQRQAENTLAVLRGIAPGMEPAEVQSALAAAQKVPSLPLTEAPAAPADLLRLRPDVARAEAQALLAAADLANARADFLPQLNLTGSLSVTDNLTGAANAQSRSVSVIATPFISIPLFDWGSRLSAAGVRHARFQQRLIEYQQTVLNAVSESSTALTSLDQGSRRLVAARAAEDAAGRTARGSRAAFEAGIQSLADRLRADQQLIDARLTRIDAEAQQASAGISVYRAFGGGVTTP